MSWHWVFSHSRSTKVLPFATACVSGVVCGMVVGRASYCLTVDCAVETAVELADAEPDGAAALPPLLLLALLQAAAASTAGRMPAASTQVRAHLGRSLIW